MVSSTLYVLGAEGKFNEGIIVGEMSTILRSTQIKSGKKYHLSLLSFPS